MKSKVSKIGAVVLAVLLFGTALFVPASSAKVENKISIIPQDLEEQLLESLEPFYGDRSYIIDPVAPLNRGDNDDAGYKRDVGNEISRAYAIYPNEIEDNWPGRGTTGKLSSYDDEDWYFFCVCAGQQIQITMTPPNGYNFDIGLWDVNEVELASSTNPNDDPESITYTATTTLLL